jgi:hypothetical protein
VSYLRLREECHAEVAKAVLAVHYLMCTWCEEASRSQRCK